MSLEGVVFVVVVSLIIASIGAIYSSIYFGLLLQSNPIIFWLLVPPFTIIYLLLLISYFRAICTSPGKPHPELNQQFTSQDIERYMLNAERIRTKNKQRRKRRRLDADPQQLAQLSETTYCQKCDVIKLPRVHHCKICNQCVQRMDHHCPWIGNCVGRDNHKYFILFLLYATLGLSIVWGSLAVDGLANWPLLSQLQSSAATTLIALAGGGALILCLAIGGLLVTQLMMATYNYTTLESFIPGVEDKSPFDQEEWKDNFREIFGGKCWLLPVAPDLPLETNRWRSVDEGEHLEYRSPEVYAPTMANYK